MEGGKKIADFMGARPDGFATLEEASDAVAAYNPHRPRPKDISGLMKNLRLRDDGRLHWHWDPRFFKNEKRMEPPQFAETLLVSAEHVRLTSLLVRGMPMAHVLEGIGRAACRGRAGQDCQMRA